MKYLRIRSAFAFAFGAQWRATKMCDLFSWIVFLACAFNSIHGILPVDIGCECNWCVCDTSFCLFFAVDVVWFCCSNWLLPTWCIYNYIHLVPHNCPPFTWGRIFNKKTLIFYYLTPRISKINTKFMRKITSHFMQPFCGVHGYVRSALHRASNSIWFG